MTPIARYKDTLRSSLAPLVRVLFPFGAERVVLRGPLRGVRYVVASGMGMTYAFGARGYGVDHWAVRVRRGMAVYDVGANCGQVMLILAQLVGEHGHVYSFEPSPEPYALLERNVALNGLQQRVSTQRLALADRAGSAAFLWDPGAPTQSKLRDVELSYRRADAQVIEVATESLDALIARPGMRTPDVIKIDVEGGAAGVLAGARETLATHSPAVYIELHGPDEQCAVRDQLQALGYRLFRLDGSEVFEVVERWESPLWCVRPRAAG